MWRKAKKGGNAALYTRTNFVWPAGSGKSALSRRRHSTHVDDHCFAVSQSPQYQGLHSLLCSGRGGQYKAQCWGDRLL